MIVTCKTKIWWPEAGSNRRHKDFQRQVKYNSDIKKIHHTFVFIDIFQNYLCYNILENCYFEDEFVT